MEFLKTNIMKNLENYGVQELNTLELKTTDGGIVGLLIGCTVLLLATSCAGGCAAVKAPIYDDVNKH